VILVVVAVVVVRFVVVMAMVMMVVMVIALVAMVGAGVVVVVEVEADDGKVELKLQPERTTLLPDYIIIPQYMRLVKRICLDNDAHATLMLQAKEALTCLRCALHFMCYY
jgi:hypothetical protein